MEFTNDEESSSPYEQTELFGNISKAYKKGHNQFFDFTIECIEQDTVKAHKFILAAQSKFFQAFFTHEDKNSLSLSFQKEPMKNCIDFLYTGKAELYQENVQNIIEVANFLEIIPLCNLCAQFLVVRLNEDNISELSNLGSMMASSILQRSSIDFLLNNPKQTTKLFLSFQKNF